MIVMVRIRLKINYPSGILKFYLNELKIYKNELQLLKNEY